MYKTVVEMRPGDVFSYSSFSLRVNVCALRQSCIEPSVRLDTKLPEKH